MELWMTVLLPELNALIKPHGPCEGALVVHQEDNTGSHIDKTYKAWLQAQFDACGWKLEHQAPQCPPLHQRPGPADFSSYEQETLRTPSSVV